MLRGFRHTLFLLLQIGIVVSGAIALAVRPDAWPAIAICVAGSVMASLVVERIAGRYLRSTLGRLRRLADDIGRGRRPAMIEAQPGDDFYKLISAINLVATRLAEASQEEIRLHEELRRRERLAFLGQLAATVAHEVNNPLDGVQNCSRILRRSLGDAARAVRMLDLIDSGLSRIDVIVRRLLTLAREHVIRPVEARVGQIVDSALEAAATKIEGRGIQVIRECQTHDDRAMIDPQLLEQVFVNLVLNAADSMSNGGELTIRLSRQRLPSTEPHAPADRSVLRIEVADSGTGIAPEVLPHIFEPFYTTKSGGKGTGLGLPIAARIVDAHRGTIDVSPRENGGTVFAVCIPALPASAEGAELPGESRDSEAMAPTGR